MAAIDGAPRWLHAPNCEHKRARGSLVDIHDQRLAPERQAEAMKHKASELRLRSKSFELGPGNTTRADEASSKAKTVSTAPEAGGAVMGEANEAMERITTSSAKISNIIGLIDDMAFQTNLLTLNASVEAARAGDAGNGFAVVAVEVRRLAQSSAEASSQIKTLIEQSTRGVQAGTTKAVRSAIRQLDKMAQHNAALVEDTNAAIEQTETQAVDLDRIVETLVMPGTEMRRERAPASSRAPKATSIKAASSRYLARDSSALAVEPGWDEF